MSNPMHRANTPRGGRCRALLLALASLLFLDGAAASGDEEVSKEQQIKAAYLYNFAKYVEWPVPSFPNAASPLVIGVYCADEFGSVLESIVRDRTINGRRLVVKTLKAAAEAISVHTVYVCAENEALWEPIGNAVKESPTLTVADSEQPGSPGTAIHFVLDGDKVRFGINMDQAQRAGLKISDQLQKLAITVKRVP